MTIIHIIYCYNSKNPVLEGFEFKSQPHLPVSVMFN